MPQKRKRRHTFSEEILEVPARLELGILHVNRVAQYFALQLGREHTTIPVNESIFTLLYLLICIYNERNLAANLLVCFLHFGYKMQMVQKMHVRSYSVFLCTG